MANTSNNFYDSIISAGMSMQKTASAQDIEKVLEDSDLSAEELNKLASEIEDALNDEDIDDIDDAEVNENVDEVEGEGSDDIEDTDVDEDAEGESDELEGEGSDEADYDVEQLAAAYDEEFNKYASEGKSTRDYVFDKVADEEFACTVGDMAEKLAFVAELNPFIVADDLLNMIASKIDSEEGC